MNVLITIDVSFKIGGQRCHDLSGTQCVMPQLGSGPFTNSSGSGYYSVQDYIEILEYAQNRSIQVHVYSQISINYIMRHILYIVLLCAACFLVKADSIE